MFQSQYFFRPLTLPFTSTSHIQPVGQTACCVPFTRPAGTPGKDHSEEVGTSELLGAQSEVCLVDTGIVSALRTGQGVNFSVIDCPSVAERDVSSEYVQIGKMHE